MSVWKVEYTDQFGAWYETLTEEDQDAVVARVDPVDRGRQEPGRSGEPELEPVVRPLRGDRR